MLSVHRTVLRLHMDPMVSLTEKWARYFPHHGDSIPDGKVREGGFVVAHSLGDSPSWQEGHGTGDGHVSGSLHHSLLT